MPRKGCHYPEGTHTHLPISQFLAAYFSPSYRRQNQTTMPALFHPTVATMVPGSSGQRKYVHLRKPLGDVREGKPGGWGVRVRFKAKEDRNNMKKQSSWRCLRLQNQARMASGPRKCYLCPLSYLAKITSLNLYVMKL